MSELQVGQKVWHWDDQDGDSSPTPVVVKDLPDAHGRLIVTVMDSPGIISAHVSEIYKNIEAVNTAIEAHADSECRRLRALRVDDWYWSQSNELRKLSEVHGKIWKEFDKPRWFARVYTKDTVMLPYFDTLEEAKAAVEKELGIAEVRE